MKREIWHVDDFFYRMRNRWWACPHDIIYSYYITFRFYTMVKFINVKPCFSFQQMKEWQTKGLKKHYLNADHLPAWQCPCTQNECHEDVIWQGLSERSRVACIEHWPQPHITALGWMGTPRLISVFDPTTTLMAECANPHSFILKSIGKLSQKSGGYYKSKRRITSGMGCSTSTYGQVNIYFWIYILYNRHNTKLNSDTFLHYSGLFLFYSLTLKGTPIRMYHVQDRNKSTVDCIEHWSRLFVCLVVCVLV